MTVYVDGRRGLPKRLVREGHNIVVFAAPDEIARVARLTGLPLADMQSCREPDVTRYDYAQGFDFISLFVPSFADIMAQPGLVEIYHAPRLLVVLHAGQPFVAALQRELEAAGDVATTQLLYWFFNKLVEHDAAKLEDMEEQISDLEDSMMDTLPKDCTLRISAERKKLLVLKRYYEGLYDVMQDMEENPNGLFTKAELRVLRMLAARVDRLFNTVLNLRDYVTQVRESYQSQMDISLNKTMKLLTVVTTVFMPLSLIVGWYGMNLQMPEYAWPYAYPVVIAVSVAVAVATIAYFKKMDWF